MLSVSRPLDTRSFPLGQRPGIAHLARGVPNPGWESKVTESAASARVWAYPSPPMSGPPNAPSRTCRETSQRGEPPTLYSGSGAVPHHVYRERPLQQQHGQPPSQHLPAPRSYPHESRGFPGPEKTMAPTPSYAPGHVRGASQPAYQRPHTTEGPYPMTGPAPATENQSFSPPKSQRKTKGHVASACVPCKRAHLRCDAQRPCSRCLSNGKEDACVDVQHKKRGRPRLRDDRDARLDPLRPPHYQDMSLQRPLSTYTPGGAVVHGSDEMMQRQQAYRQLEAPPRQFVERAPDGSIYGPPPAGYPEPVAYLTMGMDFAKASPTFLDAIGAVNVTGRKLSDVAASTEADKIFGMQNRLLGEQKRREPNYLPPILGLGPAFQGTGFGAEDVARFRLNIQDQLAFVGSDGYARPFPLSMGLGKEGSFFFIVMLLSLPPRYPLSFSSDPTQIPGAVSYHGTPRPPEGLGTRAGPGPAFDPVRHRIGESPSDLRSPLSLQNLASQASPVTSPGIVSPVSPFGGSVSASRYSGPAEQPHHGPSVPGGLLPSFAGQQRFQLPPIRAHSEQRSSATTAGYGWRRDERSGRVDIGGLIDKPEDKGGEPR